MLNFALLISVCLSSDWEQYRYFLHRPAADRTRFLEALVSQDVADETIQLAGIERLSRELNRTGKCAEAIEWVEKGTLLAKSLNDHKTLVKLFQIEAAAACRLADYDRGVIAASKSIGIAERHGLEWDILNVMPFIERGVNRSFLEDFDSAIEDLERAIAIAVNFERKDWELRALGNLASVYAAMRDWTSEAATLESAMPLAEEMQDHSAVASLQANMGTNLLARNQFDLAVEKFRESFALAKAHNLNRVAAIATKGIGDVLWHKRKFKAAKVHYDDAKQLFDLIHDPAGSIKVRSRLADLNLILNDVSTTDRTNELKRLVDEAEGIGNRKLVASLLDKLIAVHRDNKDWEKTAELLLRRQEIEREIWAQESNQVQYQIQSNQQELTQQKLTASYLTIACIVLFSFALSATVLYRVKRQAAERLRADNVNIRQNELANILKERRIAQQEKFESIATMSAGVVHDFNNFLAAIVSSAELGQLVDEPTTKDQMFESILNTGMSAADLTRNLSDFMGHGKVSNGSCELNELLSQENGIWTQLVDAKVNLVVRPLGQPVWVRFDPVEIKQIISNLVKNAAEAIGSRIGEIEIEMQLLEASSNATSARPVCRLSVRDNGRGMSAEAMERATDPFFSSKGVGRGLGLASVKGIVERNGGAIQIRSTLGQGCEITIEMQTTAEPAIVEDLPANEKELEAIAGVSFKRILIVEDDTYIRQQVQSFFERYGAEITVAEGVEQAAGQIKSAAPFDCIVTDFRLADQTAHEVVTIARRFIPRTPILLVSGYAQADVYESDCFDAFLPKPFRLTELLEVVHRLTSRTDDMPSGRQR